MTTYPKPEDHKPQQSWLTKSGLVAHALWVNNSHYCGYITLPKKFGHPHYDDLNVDVHGGLTFNGYLDMAEGYLVGFDCAHSGDQIGYRGYGTFRDINFVIDQCEQLADQLIAIGQAS